MCIIANGLSLHECWGSPLYGEYSKFCDTVHISQLSIKGNGNCHYLQCYVQPEIHIL
jgi:hypothetical protein